MARVASDLEWIARLSEQLETLSTLAESLTYRVLELEERLVRQDQVMMALQSASDDLAAGFGVAVEERIHRSEERLARMEELLQENGKASLSGRTLRALPTRPRQQQILESTRADPPEEDHVLGESWVDDPQETKPEAQDSSIDGDPPRREGPFRGRAIAS